MSETTTIQLPKRIKKELDSFREYERETYADILGRLIALIRENEESKLELSLDTLRAVKEAREDVKRGRVFTSKRVKRELGL